MPDDNGRSQRPHKRLYGDSSRAYTSFGYGTYREGIGTLKASGGDCGGGSEVLIIQTLVFDAGQITSPTNGNKPKWGGCCHSLSGNVGRTVVIIREVDMTYQRVTGTLNPGGHPGSYNGQDAYSDMLVVEDGRTDCDGIRTGERRNHAGGGVRH